jgi:hypothetical protein
LEIFANASLEIGPSDVKLLDINALGVLVINRQGVAGDLQVSVEVGQIAAIEEYFQMGNQRPSRFQHYGC